MRMLVTTLVALMALCAMAEDRQSFQRLPRDQQVTRIKALLVKGFLDDKLKEFLESLKEMMLNGNEEWGLPKLDPFNYEHLDVNLNETVAQVTATLDELSVTGLSNYDVNLATFNLVKQNISFGLFFHGIHAMAENYYIDSLIANMVPVFGEGSLDIRVTNLSIGGYIVIGINGSYVYLKDVNLDVGIGALTTNITGLLGGGELSELINEIISGSAPELWESLKPDIMPEINKLVIDLGNNLLTGVTLQDIIDLIMGNKKRLHYKV